MKRRWTTALVLALELLSIPAAAQQVTSLRDLCEVPAGRTVHQFSSHNREGRNGDDGWCLYHDETGRAVIFDAVGPGCVRSVWATDVRDDSVLHFLFDGEAEPRYSIPQRAFFEGKHELFPPPLASYDLRGYYGDRPYAGNCFVPIPFAKALRIAVSGELHFYHVIWESYPHGTRVETFTGKEDRSFVLDAFARVMPEDVLGFPRAGSTLDALRPREDAPFLSEEGPGCLRELVVEGPATETFVRDVWIRLVFDGHERADVHAPLGYFFGSAVRPNEMRSLPLDVDLLEEERVRLTCRFPMPFATRAEVHLLNRSAEEVGPVEVRAARGPLDVAPESIATFTTLFREGWTTYGRDWLLQETPGTGWYVGTVQTMLGEHYCEGDEHFALDGAISPQLNGTGTEDYYLGCFWPNREYDSPFACCVGDVLEEAGDFTGSYERRACYSRYHLEAPIPFYSHLDAFIQHGGFDTIRSSYGSLSFCYLRQRPVLFETDLVDVGNEASEAQHEYAATAGVPTGWIVARGEGRDHLVEHRGRGRVHEEEGAEITFTVAIDPENRGVRLRRRLDQGSPRQTAEVWLDGELVGTWYHADHNATLRWFDSDFDLHPCYTSGKSTLAVELVVRREGGRGAFTDYEYRVFCFGS